MNAIVIRFEGSSAICRKESRAIFEIRRGLLPLGTEEGDVLEIFGSSISRNFSEMGKRRNRIEELLKDILV